jgi:hypothetical protein
VNKDTWTEYLEGLKRIGYQDFDVAEMVNNLAGLPPMTPIFILDEDTDEKKFVNNIELLDGKILLMHIGKHPKNKNDGDTHDEKVAEKKRKAEELTLDG